MSHIFVTSRKAANGRKRYVVRYRWGGRSFKLVHLGSRPTLREARTLRDWGAGQLAAGRDPRAEMARLATEAASPAKVAPLDSWWERFIASRVDVTDGTRGNYRKAKAAFSQYLGTRDPQTLAVADVQDGILQVSNVVEPSTLAKYVSTLRQVMDFTGIEPNVARDRRVKLPAIVYDEPDPPDAADVLAMLEQLSRRWRLAFVTTEQTGMRVGEIASVLWRDVDVSGSQFRVRMRETKSRRAKWVPVPPWLMDEIADSCPLEDRLPDRPVFERVTEDGLRNAMLRACRVAEIPGYSPHDLRHRRITIWHHAGLPTKTIQDRVGHSRASTTLDVYAHVMPVKEVPMEALLAALSRSGEVSVRSRA